MKFTRNCLLLTLILVIVISCIGMSLGAQAASEITISSPKSDSVWSWDDAITVKWNAVTGAVGYYVSIRNLNTDNLVLSNKWTTSTSMRVGSYIPEEIGRYKIWVGAVDSSSKSGSECFTHTYVEIIISHAPDITIGSASNITENSVTLSMTINKDYGYSIDDWGFYVGTSSSVSKMTQYSYGYTTKGTKTATITGLSPNTTYYYRAFAENYVDEEYTSYNTFTTKIDNLDKPVITSPANYSDAYSAGNSITLKWNTVTGATGYQYYIKQLSGDPDPSNDDEPSINSWSATTTSLSYTLASSNVKGGYWYKFVVRAYASGVESWSEWRYVYIPFDKPVITAPSNWSEVNAGNSITVKWNAVSGADAYKSHIIRLKGQPDNSNDSEQKLALSVDGSYQGEWRIDRGTTRSYTLNGSYVVGGYWYKIVIEAKNTTKGISSWSNWYYVYANETGNLERPVITSPVAYQNYEAGDPISFVWQAVDNATSYKYYIKQLVGEPDNSDNEQAANSWIGEVKASNRRYTLPGKYVQPNTWYKFVVEAKADGYYSGWSRYTYIKIPDRVDWIHYVLPEAMTEISDESFEGNKLLRTFDASKSELSSIGSRAFANCTNLLSINLPITVESIAEDAFTNCPNLTIHCIKGSAAETYANRKKIAVEIHGVAMDTDTVKLSQSNWDVAYAEKAEASVRVTSSDDWSASSNRTWLRVNKTTGSNGTNIVLTADENSTGQKRSGTITFTCGNAKAYLEVSQNNIYASVATEATAKPAPIVTGSWNDSSTITVTLGGTYQLSGYVNVQNGYLGNVSVSVQGGSDRALNNDYAGSVSMINLSEESFFNINTSTNTNFNKAGTYRLVMYAKAYGSTNAIKIGEKTLIVEEPVAVQKPVVSFTRTSATVLNNGTGKFNLTVSTTYTDMFYVELLKNGTPVDIYDDYVKTVQKREYNEADFKNVATLYTTSKKTWPMLSAITIPSGTAEGTYTIRVTAVNNQGKSSTATANLEVVSKIAMKKVTLNEDGPINLVIDDPDRELTYTLEATYAPLNATENKLLWSSSDNSVVSIQSDGKTAKIIAHKEGNAIITVYNSTNNSIKDNIRVYVWKVFGGRYRILHTFVVDGNEYKQAELMEDYKEIRKNTIFYLDKSDKVVTNKAVLAKLFTMQIFLGDVFLENDRDYVNWTSILRDNNKAARNILISDEVYKAAGEIVGEGMKVMLSPEPVTLVAGAFDMAGTALDVGALCIQLHVMNSITNTAIRYVDITNKTAQMIRNGNTFYYNDIDNFIELYINCMSLVESSNAITRPIIDDLLAEYTTNVSYAAKHFKDMAKALSGSLIGVTDNVNLKASAKCFKFAWELADGGTDLYKLFNQLSKEEVKEFTKDLAPGTDDWYGLILDINSALKTVAEFAPDQAVRNWEIVKGFYIGKTEETKNSELEMEQSGFYNTMIKLAE